MLQSQAGCEESKEKIGLITFSSDYEEVKNMLKQTDDGAFIISRYGSPGISGLKNIENSLKRVEVGGVLSMEELLEIGKLLKVISKTVEYKKSIVEKSAIDYLFERLLPEKQLEKNIFNSIIAADKMSDDASPTLSEIRRKTRNTQSKIRSILDNMVSSSSFQKYLQDPIISMRDGRYVVPVKQEYRGQVKGVVHGTSATGATIFIEPIKVVDANNEISILHGKEEEEIYKILSILSNDVLAASENIRGNYKDLIDIDIVFAKSKLGLLMNGTVPILNIEGRINLKGARHPLIDREKVVPIDIRLGEDFDTLMITGPNTGGKTVALKTLGLLTLMTMCGLMIPAKADSQLSIFNKVLADIGEEQSIEQSLSTFSAHITHVIEILDIVDNKTLVLFDELGAGTDPVEGAALAMAIIEEVRKKGCKIALTTHYSELKIYALNTEKVENASCEFDVTSLKPTYRLLIGTPGRSNAFAIAKKLGISNSIIENAMAVVDGEKAEFEEVVSTLEKQRIDLEKEYEIAKREKERMETARRDLEKKIESQLKIREKEVEKVKEQTKAIIMRTQYQSNKLIKDLEELKKEKERDDFSFGVSRARSEVANILDEIENGSNELQTVREKYELPRELEVGDIVRISSLNATGTVIKTPERAGKVLVQAGIIKTEVDISAIRLIENANKVSFNNSQKGYSKVKRNKTSDKILEIDIRGQNLEEGLMNMDQFIDSSVLSKHNSIMIIHGKGTGVLKDGVREHLKRHKSIRTHRPGVFGEGEDGVTIAELK